MRVTGAGGIRESFAVLAALALAVPVACTGSSKAGDDEGGTGGRAGSGTGGGGATGGKGGNAGKGGSSSAGSAGSSGRGSGGASSGGSAGAGATSGEAGTAGNEAGAGGSTSDAGEGGLGGAGACEDLDATATLVPSTVTLLVDNSSSMFETQPPAWGPLHDALMSPTFGVVKELEGRIRFGFASYRGSASPTAEDDATCASWTKVAPAMDNHASIEAEYGVIAWPPGTKWETPTGHAIRQATSGLLDDDAPGQKIILLITDGNPNTCQVLSPECGQDNSIAAAQAAFAAGVRLLAVGVGDIIAQPNNGCPTSARCGPLHLQDLANAGVGAPVRPAPGCDDPTSMDCVLRFSGCSPGNELIASYTPDAPDVGTPLLLDTASSPTPASLADAIQGVLDPLVSCTLELDVTVTGNPESSTVTVANVPVPFEGSARGFTLDPNKYAITLTGTACDDFRDGAPVNVTFHCDSVTGRPVAVPR